MHTLNLSNEELVIIRVALHQRAQRLYNAADTLDEQRSVDMSPADTARLQSALASLRKAAGEYSALLRKLDP